MPKTKYSEGMCEKYSSLIEKVEGTQESVVAAYRPNDDADRLPREVLFSSLKESDFPEARGTG